MAHRISPGWGSLTLLIAILYMAVSQTTGQQICAQSTPGSCPSGYYCSANNICEKISSDDTTTYVIIGTVLAGIIIITAVILILYCGRWGWLQRLTERFAGRETITKPQPLPMPPVLPAGPLLFQAPPRVQQAPHSTWQRLKLRFGGIQQQSPVINGPSPFEAAPTSMLGFPQPSPEPSVLGLNANTGYLGSTATYVIGQGTTEPTSIDNHPYVATVNVDSTVPAIQYPGNAPRPGEQVTQLGGIVQTTYTPPSPTLQYQAPPSPGPYVTSSSQMVSQSPPSPRCQHTHAPQPVAQQYPQPPAQQYQPVMPSVQAPQPAIHVHHVPHIHEPAPIQHSHQVFPNVYPSLNRVQGSVGHAHSHSPPAYMDVARKY